MFRTLAGLEGSSNPDIKINDEVLKKALEALSQTQFQPQINPTNINIPEVIPVIPPLGTNVIEEIQEELPIPKILQLEQKPVHVIPRGQEFSIETRNGNLSGFAKKKDIWLLGTSKPDKPEIYTNPERPLARQTILALASGKTYNSGSQIKPRPTRKSINRIFDNTILVQGSSAKDMLLNAIAPTIPGKDIPSETTKRTLFLQESALNGFDFCDDLADATLPPYNPECLQKLFLKLGGTKEGTLYPTEIVTVTNYNIFTNWGKVRDYLNRLVADVKSKDLNKKSEALKALYGIQYDIGWMNLPNKMTYLQISTNNTIVGIDSNFTMWRYTTKTGWKKLSGQGLQISVGMDGTICCIDKKSIVYLYHEGTDSWTAFMHEINPVEMLKIAVYNAQSIYGYNSLGQLWFYNGIKWTYVQGVSVGKDIAVGTDASLYYIGPHATNNGPIYYYRPGSTWNSMANMNASIISAGDVANVWCIDSENNVYKWNTVTWVNEPTKMRTIAVGPEGKLILGIDIDGSVHFRVNNKWLEVSSN